MHIPAIQRFIRTQEAIMFKLYLVRTTERALYADEQILMGIFDSLASAAQALGSQFQFCDVITMNKVHS